MNMPTRFNIVLKRAVLHIHYYRRPLLVFLISGALAAIIFFFLFGFAVVNPTYDTWIKIGAGDLGQNYIGWLFYRSAPWGPTLGSIGTLAYPHGMAVTFMDSIPLAAIFFKSISFLLPVTFQYFGLWGLISYILLGGFGGLIIYKLTHQVAVSVIASLLFSSNPLMIYRMFAHTALASQWIVLAGILALVSMTKTTKSSRFITIWSIILALSACIHPYFLPMSGVLFFMSLILTTNTWRSSVLRLLIPMGITVIVFGLIGGFVVSDIAGGELGEFGLNLNALINPLGWSSLLLVDPATSGAYEGLAYLGVGVLLLVPVALYALLKRVLPSTSAHELKVILKRANTYRWIGVLVIGFLLLVAAIGPVIHIGDIMHTYIRRHSIINLWATFRATSRLFWPLYYLIVTGLIVVVIRLFSQRRTPYAAVAFLVFIVGIQFVDVLGSQKVNEKREAFSYITQNTYSPSINEAVWHTLAMGRAHIQYIGAVDVEQFYPIAYFAAGNNLTMSDGYFARSPGTAVLQTSNDARAALLSGKGRRDTIYLTTDRTVVNAAQSMGGLNIINDNGQFILTKN